MSVKPQDVFQALSAAQDKLALSQWQPIKTAPRDREFLVWHRNRVRQVQFFNGPVLNSDTVIDPVAGRMWVATHWMPLLEPPK